MKKYSIIVMIFIMVSKSFCEIKEDSIIYRLNKLPSDSNKVIFLNELSYQNYLSGDYQSELDYAEQALTIAKKNNWEKGIANSLKNKGGAYDDLGIYPKALEEYNRALNLFVKLKNKQGEADVLNNIGLVYYNLGDYFTAIKYHLNALKIREVLADQSGIAKSHGNLGIAYTNLMNYDESLDYNFKALTIQKAIHDSTGMAKSYSNIGLIKIKIKDFEDAILNYNKALEIHKLLGNKNGIASCYHNIGINYIEQSEYIKALENYKKSLELYKEIQDPLGIANSSSSIGFLLIKTKKFSDSEKYLVEAKNIANELAAKEVLKNVYGYLSLLYEIKGDTKQAFYNYRLYITYRDSLINQEITEKSMVEKMQYEFDKKETLLKSAQEKKEAISKAEISKQKLLRNFLLLGFAMVLLLTTIIFKNYKTQKKVNRIIEKQKTDLNNKKILLEEKHKEIKDSINYAERIQQSVIASGDVISKYIGNYFILYRPKDIVSGDFYWFAQKQEWSILACVDCTGHGVPGAFMSMIGNTLLNKIILERNIIRPDQILNELDKEIKYALNKNTNHNHSNDGMDISVCAINFTEQLFLYSGANRPLYLIRNNELLEFKANKFAIGGYLQELEKKFTLHEILTQKGDTLYLSTDGYADQFSSQNKKLKTKRFKEILLSIQHLPIPEQGNYLDKFITDWRGNMEQTDDVLVIGVRV